MAHAINSVMLLGYLGKDPEVKVINDTTMCKMTLATSYRFKNRQGEYEDRTEWHNIVAWGSLADYCANRLTKGSRAYFKGSLQHRNWDDKDGKKCYMTEVRAMELIPLTEAKTVEAA